MSFRKSAVALGVVGCAVLAAGSSLAGTLTERIAAKHKVKTADTWYGGRRTVFDFNGYDAWVVEPPEGVAPADGRPWSWTMQWREAFVARTGVPQLLKRGYHHVAIDTFKHRMDEKGLAVSADFQKFLVEELGLNPKANLIGLSWGGFFPTRYAVRFPQNVRKVYLDSPLLTYRRGRADDVGPWTARYPADGNWLLDPEMPVNQAAALAKTGIPVLLLYGGQDSEVEPATNAELFERRFRDAGGDIRVLCRPAFGHHPHGVEPTEPTIVNFFEARPGDRTWPIGIRDAFSCLERGGDAGAVLDDNLSVLISDIHLQMNPNMAYSFTAREFPKRVREILAMRPLPRRVICFGDMTFNDGEPASYAFLREQLEPLKAAGIDVFLAMGNHDRRKNFLAVFPEAGKDQPVPGRIVYRIDLGHCDLILLDSLNGAEKAVGGELGKEQEAWLKREVAAAKRPLLLGAHHTQAELSVDGKSLYPFMRANGKVIGWINGHEHYWQKANLFWGEGANEDVIRTLMLPTGGAWGEIGLVTLRTYPDRAVAKLKMIDMVWHDALRPGEKRPKSFDAIVEDMDGEKIIFPFERPLLRAKKQTPSVKALTE